MRVAWLANRLTLRPNARPTDRCMQHRCPTPEVSATLSGDATFSSERRAACPRRTDRTRTEPPWGLCPSRTPPTGRPRCLDPPSWGSSPFGRLVSQLPTTPRPLNVRASPHDYKPTADGKMKPLPLARWSHWWGEAPLPSGTRDAGRTVRPCLRRSNRQVVRRLLGSTGRADATIARSDLRSAVRRAVGTR